MSSTGVVRRNRTPLLVAVGVLVLLVVVAWFQRDSVTYSGPLDPRNPEDQGAQAVARVLDDHGVDVTIVRDQAAYLQRQVDPDTTVVVTNPQDLGKQSLAELRRHASAAGAVVLVGPAESIYTAFALVPGNVPAGEVPAHCDVPLATGLTVTVPVSAAVIGSGCFDSGDAVLLTQPAGDERTWLFTAPEVFSNEHVLDGDNAALALRLLGQHGKLLWYVADSADTSASDAVTIASLLPGWLYPSLWQLALSALAFLLWRARRLGPLVREPLPVVVRAAESTESRGRLYRKTRDRDHAAAILRQASRRRLADALAVRPDAPVPDLAAAVAGRTGGDLDAVRRMLTDGPVPNDSALAVLGRELLRLEYEVRNA
jgi:hypothetical protein